MIAGGVLAGANTPMMDSDSYPGSVDATVGRSGVSADGSRLVTASALSLPDLMCGVTADAVENMIWFSPEINPVNAGPVPLYGMRTMFTPAMDLNNSADRCVGTPVAPEP